MGFFVTPRIYSNIAQRDVLAGVLPLQNSARKFDGVMVVTLDVRWLDTLLRLQGPARRRRRRHFRFGGHLDRVERSRGGGANLREPASGRPASEANCCPANGPDGTSYSYTVVAAARRVRLCRVRHARYAICSRGTYLHVATDLLLPVLMLGAASLAIWIATDRLVTRWIVYLRRIATAYGRGHYAIRPAALADAPSEFRLLGETFSNMAAAVQDRDRELREALEQKSLLIKETHHRVKNNLQIVMSLLSLQSGQLKDPASQSALRQAQARVNALALVHRILHEIEDLDAVDVKALLQDLVASNPGGLRRRAPRSAARARSRVAARAERPRGPAHPVHGRGADQCVQARLSRRRARRRHSRDACCRSRTANCGSPSKTTARASSSRTPATQGIGSRLIQAFAQQIGGTPSVTSRPGGRHDRLPDLRRSAVRAARRGKKRGAGCPLLFGRLIASCGDRSPMTAA